MIGLGITKENINQMLENMHDGRSAPPKHCSPDHVREQQILDVIKRNPGCSKHFAKHRSGYKSNEAFGRLEKRGLIEIGGTKNRLKLYAIG